MTENLDVRIAGLIVAAIAIFINYFVGSFTWNTLNTKLSSMTILWAILTTIAGIIGAIVFVTICIITLVGLYVIVTGEVENV